MTDLKYKRYLIECSSNYNARIYRCPQQSGDFDFTLHWHRDYEFIYVEKGPLQVLKLDSQITLNDGDFYFINSEEIHSYAEVNENLKFIVVNIPYRSLLPYVKNQHQCPKFAINNNEIHNNDELKEMARLMKALYDIEDYGSCVEYLKIKGLVNGICYFLIKYFEVDDVKYFPGSQSDDFDCARSAVIYMEKNYKKNIPLNEIAEYVGMTPAHFSKYFKDKTEITFSRYLRKIRLEHAIYDMLHNNMPVNMAAKENGFPNVNSFIITCKSEYGRTPLEMKIYTQTS